MEPFWPGQRRDLCANWHWHGEDRPRSARRRRAVSGLINTLGAMGNITIGGSLIGASFSGGGGFFGSGYISSALGIGPVKIGHDIVGGSVTGTVGSIPRVDQPPSSDASPA